MKKTLIRILKITGISLGSLLALMFLLPFLFPGFVSTKIKAWASHAIVGQLNFSKARLSFFNHFPSLTLTLYDFSLKGSDPFPNDTLVAAKEVALGVNLSTIFSKSININEIYLTRGLIHVLVDTAGNANYNVYRSDTTANKDTTKADTTGASLQIQRIQIDGTDVIYDDRSLPLLITADNLNYLGKGNLSQAIFDLYSHMSVDTFDLDYGHQHYIGSKQLNADLVTRINTRSLSFMFEKNDLRLNSLPVQLRGRFDFLKEGYDMEFVVKTDTTALHDVLTALPPEYSGWLDSTTIKGTAALDAILKGKYDAKTNTMPDLSFHMMVRDGYIANRAAPTPIQNIFLNLQSVVPGLNPDSFYVSIDSLYFTMDRDYFSTTLSSKGLSSPVIHARVHSALDLEKWDRAIGLAPYDLKGRVKMDFSADGRYATKVVRKGLRQLDTVVASIPEFHGSASMDRGYFKYASMPKALEDIAFQVDAACPDHDYHHLHIDMDSLHARLADNLIHGGFHMSFANDLTIDANLHTNLHLADIYSFYPMDSLKLGGDLKVDATTKGVYDPAHRLFPTTTAMLAVKDGNIQTKYYPHPIEHIEVSALITNTTGTMRSLQVQLTPVSFQFEGQPFTMQANLKNFDDLLYNLKADGTIDVGKIYTVFARQGIDLKGLIRTHLALAGLQSDATSGHYDRLNNSGTMELDHITLTSDMFPKPLLVETGVFRFQQEKMWFDRFNASYGKTHFSLDGYLTNLVAYATQPNAPLSGNFQLKSNAVYVDELMAFSGGQPAKAPAGQDPHTSPAPAGASGVIIVPSNLSLGLQADVKKVYYNGLILDSCKGDVRIDSAQVFLNKLGFIIIGAPVTMDAAYGSLSPVKAKFNYHINAQNFSVKRAYNEIKIFHDMCTSAAKANGIISLDYQLKGLLDANMHPVYPSLTGGGAISLADVKVNGLKIFGAMSKATGKDSVNNPHLSGVVIKSTIAHNIITIERTRMKVEGFRPRFEGQVGLDGKLNLQCRLGLPPFGIIGIPMTITGTGENPVVHTRKERKEDELKEQTEDQ